VWSWILHKSKDIQEKTDSLTQRAIALNTKKASLQEQARVAYARARKAEWARTALDQLAEIILELIDESVDRIRKEAAVFNADTAIADTEARELFAEASAMQGTLDRYKAAITAAPPRQEHGRKEDRRPHPYNRGKSNGGRGTKGWRCRRF
jgi:uncharacterized coiled-coil DUF342 family protein